MRTGPVVDTPSLAPRRAYDARTAGRRGARTLGDPVYLGLRQGITVEQGRRLLALLRDKLGPTNKSVSKFVGILKVWTARVPATTARHGAHSSALRAGGGGSGGNGMGPWRGPVRVPFPLPTPRPWSLFPRIRSHSA